MMNCDEWKAFAQDYVFGDLNDPARELLDRHAASCASCLGEASQLKRVDRGLRQEPAVEPPAGLWKRALKDALRLPSGRALENAPAPASRELWRVAAALMIAGAIGALSITGAFARQMPDEVQRVPKVMTEAVQRIPSLFQE
jgi:putative zinc finger protein